MKVELKEICSQLTEAIELDKNHKVAACFENPESEKLVGWIIVKVDKDGKTTPEGEKYDSIKNLINAYHD